jgi:hypothetical protein
MKKLTIIAALALATAAFALPSTASAIWTHNHNHIQSGTNPVLHGEGFGGFQSSAGQIECTTLTGSLQLTGGQTTAEVTSFSASNVQTKCHTNGAIGHCTVTSVQSTGLPWVGHLNNETGVQATAGTIDSDLHGFLCPDLLGEFLPANGDFFQLITEEDGEVGHTTIDAVTLNGAGTATPLGSALSVQGELTPNPSLQNTYGWT